METDVPRARGRGTIVLGVAASDSHVVANHLIAMFLRRQRFEVVNLGACTPTEDFMCAASQASDLVAVLIGSLNGHALEDLSDLPRLRRQYGVEAPVFVGGNLSVGAVKDDRVVRELLALGVDRVLQHPRQLIGALQQLGAAAPLRPAAEQGEQGDDLSVVKFGGSSFATPAHFVPVCRWIGERLQQRGPEHRMVCVVSAPSGLTEQYREMLLAHNPNPADRLIDAALPLADSLGATLVAAALQAQGIGATAAIGNQIGLRTDSNYTRARLQAVDLDPLRHALQRHRVVVVPGGQASAAATGETTWMGKNSSDLSAIAIAAGWGREEVEICSDVPGVYSCDPEIVAEAELIPRLSHAQAIEMSASGAKVLHHRAVQHALQSGLRIVCRRNRDAFDVGTVLEPHAPSEAAVVPDARSQCFSGTAADVAEGARRLDAAGVTCCVVSGRLVVTCGFFDASHFLATEHRLALRREAEQLITVVTRDGRVLRELVRPGQLAQRARELHARCRAAREAAHV